MHFDILRVFGENVRHLRKQRGFSQERLAEISGCHPNYIGGVERGERNISLKNIVAIAGALRCSVDELFIGIKPQLESRHRRQP